MAGDIAAEAQSSLNGGIAENATNRGASGNIFGENVVAAESD